MIDFNQAISIIRRNGGFKPNKKDTSYYRTYNVQGNRPMQVRVSNHGTYLWTWYDKEYDPSYTINYCIVFSEDGNHDSDVSVDMDIKDEQGNVIGQRESFEVIQYVYNSQLLDVNDATIINQKVQSIWQNIGFEDPFAGTPKHAKVVKLKPNEEIEAIVENKNINCNKNMNKKLIRLTESDLHRIVKESVNKVLNEIGDTPRGQYHLGRATMRKIMDGEDAEEIVNYSNSKGITNSDWMTSPYYRGMDSQARYMHSLRGNTDDDMSPDDYKNTIKNYDEYYKNKRL